MQCFTPRKRNSPWTELNKERVRRLERLGLMTDAGRNYKTRDKGLYEQTLFHLVTETKARRMFGEWNDYGRLLDY
jgi:hypothetical protein